MKVISFKNLCVSSIFYTHSPNNVLLSANSYYDRLLKAFPASFVILKPYKPELLIKIIGEDEFCIRVSGEPRVESQILHYDPKTLEMLFPFHTSHNFQGHPRHAISSIKYMVRLEWRDAKSLPQVLPLAFVFVDKTNKKVYTLQTNCFGFQFVFIGFQSGTPPRRGSEANAPWTDIYLYVEYNHEGCTGRVFADRVAMGTCVNRTLPLDPLYFTEGVEFVNIESVKEVNFKQQQLLLQRHAYFHAFRKAIEMVHEDQTDEVLLKEFKTHVNALLN